MYQVVLILVAVAAFKYFRGFKRTKLPPGLLNSSAPPFSLPIFGHLLFCGENPAKTFKKWSDSYGPIVSVQLGSYPAIVINEGQLIKKAFNLSSFSGRPDVKYMHAIGGQRQSFMTSDGPRCMEQRKFIQKLLNEFGLTTTSKSDPITDQVPDLLQIFEDHLSKPLNIKHAFNSVILNALWGLVAGEHFKKDDKEFQQFAASVACYTEISSPIEKLAVFIRFISDWFPELSGYNKKIRGMIDIHKYLDSRIQEHKRTKSENLPRDIIDAYLDKVEKTTDPQSGFFPGHGNITYIMQDLFAAGGETSSSTLEWILFYLAKYPNVQEKLQEEIDSVIESNRLPCSHDRAKLPYVEATIAEVSRLSSVAPLSLFHSAMEETEFNGFTIPKGMILVGNLYAANHDKNVWGDPEVFRPQRFLDSEGNFKKSNEFTAFSWGKRNCIGANLATLQLFMYTVSIFQRFSVRPVGELPPEGGMFGLARTVFPFQLIVSKHQNGI